MVTLFTGYVDDIFYVLSNFHIQLSKFGRKYDKFGGNSKIVGSRGLHGACFFQLQGPLTLGDVRVPPSAKGIGEQDCRGKVKGRGLVEP